ncbi:reverse transcriptase domain-containing protein [Tanacetum coccineum]
MSTSTHPIIIPSDFDVEDAFSSTTTPDYTPASPDYSPASPGNTSPDPFDDLSKYLLASLAISPFHDDPYMKIMQAYNATSNESPIPPPQVPIAPPTVLPPSPVLPLSPMFDPQDFFLLEEILPPQKRAQHHEEQIETILNHLDELPLERIENMEDKIKGLEQIRHDDEIVLARVRISTLEMIIEDIQCTVFTDHKSLQHILDQKELNMRQRRWLELLAITIVRLLPSWKGNVVADALSQVKAYHGRVKDSSKLRIPTRNKQCI